MAQKLFTSAHIDRYLLGKMSPQEERDFLLYIKRDSRLRHPALVKALVIRQIKAYYSKLTDNDQEKHTNTDV